jgi:hypothetical protein
VTSAQKTTSPYPAVTALPDRIAKLLAQPARDLSSAELLELATDAATRDSWDLLGHRDHLVAICNLAIAAEVRARLDREVCENAIARAKVLERERDAARALLRDKVDEALDVSLKALGTSRREVSATTLAYPDPEPPWRAGFEFDAVEEISDIDRTLVVDVNDHALGVDDGG